MSILERIRANGGDFTRQGVRFVLKPGRLKPDALKWIRDNIDTLKREVWSRFDEFEERVAIMQFDGGMTQDAAERLAELCMREGSDADDF